MSTEKAFPAGRSAPAKGLGRAGSGGPGTQERPGMLQRDPTRPLWRSLGDEVLLSKSRDLTGFYY